MALARRTVFAVERVEGDAPFVRFASQRPAIAAQPRAGRAWEDGGRALLATAVKEHVEARE